MSLSLNTNMKLISTLRYNKFLKIQGFFLMSPSRFPKFPNRTSMPLISDYRK
jgi:hypothetical protein